MPSFLQSRPPRRSRTYVSASDLYYLYPGSSYHRWLGLLKAGTWPYVLEDGTPTEHATLYVDRFAVDAWVEKYGVRYGNITRRVPVNAWVPVEQLTAEEKTPPDGYKFDVWGRAVKLKPGPRPLTPRRPKALPPKPLPPVRTRTSPIQTKPDSLWASMERDKRMRQIPKNQLRWEIVHGVMAALTRHGLPSGSGPDVDALRRYLTNWVLLTGEDVPAGALVPVETKTHDHVRAVG